MVDLKYEENLLPKKFYLFPKNFYLLKMNTNLDLLKTYENYKI